MNNFAKTIVFALHAPVAQTGHSELRFLAFPEVSGLNETAVLRGTLPPGSAVDLHSHRDAECFYVFEGEMELYLDSGHSPGWNIVKADDLAVVKSNIKHAWRNNSSGRCVALIITGVDLSHFLREITSHDADSNKASVVAHTNNKWLAGPVENAAIGLRA